MKRLILALMVVLFACTSWPVLASRSDDQSQLQARLTSLDKDSSLNDYAQAERTLASQAVDQLATVSGRDYEHAYYMAKRRVEIAETSVLYDVARQKLSEIRHHNAEQLRELSKRDADAAKKAQEREQLQNLMAAEEADRMEQQGQAHSKDVASARQQAAKANQLAKSRSAEAAKARHEADVAKQAVELMRKQLESLKAK